MFFAINDERRINKLKETRTQLIRLYSKHVFSCCIEQISARLVETLSV